ncbi:MAG: GYF domain-containing protein [Myxococcota bacterium]
MADSNETERWFVARSGESSGPYSWPQLRAEAQQGELRSRDWIWRKGMSEWIRAREQPGLFKTIPPPVPLDASDPPSQVVSSPDETPSIPAADTPPIPAPETASDVDESDIERVEHEAVTVSIVETASDKAVTMPAVETASEVDEAAIEQVEPVREAVDADIGETTRRFLAAAGISEHVRRRRRRWAALLLVLLLLGVVGASAVSGSKERLSAVVASRDVSPKPVDEPPPRPASVQACRLTGTCAPRRASRRSTATKSPRFEAEIPKPVGIGALETSGGLVESDIAKAQVELPQLQPERDDGLSALQTAAIKAKVTPGFKRCKGVFAPSKVVVQFSTDSRGKVRKVSVPQGPGRVRRCLLRRARYWRFGRALASRRIELTVAANGGLVKAKAR